MEALILFFIGLVTGLEVVSTRPSSEDVKAEAPSSESTLPCQSTPSALSIANLEEREAPRWIVGDDGALCDPVTGRVVVLEGLRYPDIPR